MAIKTLLKTVALVTLPSEFLHILGVILECES